MIKNRFWLFIGNNSIYFIKYLLHNWFWILLFIGLMIFVNPFHSYYKLVIILLFFILYNVYKLRFKKRGYIHAK